MVELPYPLFMFNNTIVRGRFMFERDQALQVIKMAERGNLKLGKAIGHEAFGPFGMDKVDEAMEEASEMQGRGKSVVVVP